MRESKCRGIPSKPALLTEHGTLPAQKSDRRESPSGDSADKMIRERCPGKSFNGKEKRHRGRREKVSVPRFFRPSPEKGIPGLGISRSGSEIFHQTAPKSKCFRQNIAQKPRFVQKNRAKICYLGRIAQKSRHENQAKRHNLSVFTGISWYSDFLGTRNLARI